MNGQLWSYVHIAEFRWLLWSFSSALNKESRNHFHKLVFAFPTVHKFKKNCWIPRVTSLFTRAFCTFVITARPIQPTASYPYYVDIHFNITFVYYLTSPFNCSCQGFVTFFILLACHTIHPTCSFSHIFIQSVQTGSRTHPASYSLSIGGFFPGNKGAGAWCWPPNQFKAEVMEEWRYNSTPSIHLLPFYWYTITLT